MASGEKSSAPPALQPRNAKPLEDCHHPAQVNSSAKTSCVYSYICPVLAHPSGMTDAQGSAYQGALHEESVPLHQIAGILQPFGLRLLLCHWPVLFLLTDKKKLLHMQEGSVREALYAHCFAGQTSTEKKIIIKLSIASNGQSFGTYSIATDHIRSPSWGSCIFETPKEGFHAMPLRTVSPHYGSTPLPHFC